MKLWVWLVLSGSLQGRMCCWALPSSWGCLQSLAVPAWGSMSHVSMIPWPFPPVSLCIWISLSLRGHTSPPMRIHTNPQWPGAQGHVYELTTEPMNGEARKYQEVFLEMHSGVCTPEADTRGSCLCQKFPPDGCWVATCCQHQSLHFEGWVTASTGRVGKIAGQPLIKKTLLLPCPCICISFWSFQASFRREFATDRAWAWGKNGFAR